MTTRESASVIREEFRGAWTVMDVQSIGEGVVYVHVLGRRNALRGEIEALAKTLGVLLVIAYTGFRKP